MSSYSYELSNFIYTPGEYDVTLRLFDKTGKPTYTVDPLISYFFYKNNLLVIKVEDQHDITLDFVDNATAILALDKMNDLKQLIVQNQQNINSTFTKDELLNGGVLDGVYLTTGSSILFASSAHTHQYSLTGLTDVLVSGLTDGQVLVFTGGTWVNSALTFDSSAFLSDYYTKVELSSTGGTSVVDWSNINNKPVTLTGYGITDAYTKSEVYTKEELSGGTLDTRYYNIDTTLQTFYTKQETDDRLDGKSNTGHTHLMSDITDISGITETFDQKLTGYSQTGHTHQFALTGLTDVTISGETQGDFLVYSGGTWVNTQVSTPDLGNYYDKTEVDTILTNYIPIQGTTGVTGSITPSVINADLGSVTNPWQSVYVSGGVNIGYVSLTNTGDTLLINGSPIITSNTLTGHTHDERYFTKDELITGGTLDVRYYNIDTALQTFYTKTEIDTNIYNTGETYSNVEVDTLLLTHTSLTGITNPHATSFYDLTDTGHTHTEFFTKDELLSGGTLDSRYFNNTAITEAYYDKTQVDILLSGITVGGDYYTTGQTDLLLSNKSNTGHTHLSSSITDFDITGHTHDDRYFTKDELVTGGTLDVRYYNIDTALQTFYTKTEVDTNIYTTGDTYSNVEVDALISNHTSLTGITNPHATSFYDLIDTGHTHTEFFTKDELLSGGTLDSRYLNNTAITEAYYDKSQVDILISGITVGGDYYTTGQTDLLLSTKADTGHTHLSSSITDFDVTGHTHDDRYFTKDELVTGGTLDTRYYNIDTTLQTFYTKTEIDNNIYNTGETYSNVEVDALISNHTSLTGITNPHATSFYDLTDTGHTHTEFFTKDELLSGGTLDTRYLNNTAITEAYYDKSQVDVLISGITVGGDYYTTGQTDLLLSNKSDTGHTHLSSSITDFDITGHTHDDRYFTKDELLSGGTLDTRYYNIDTTLQTFYTKTEIDNNIYTTGETYSNVEVDALISVHTSLTGITNPHATSFFDLTDTGHTHGDLYFTKDELLSGGTLDTRYLNNTAITEAYYDKVQVDAIVSGITSGGGYYTTGQTDALLSNKSDTGHTHLSSSITDFDITGHTHEATTIAGFDVTGHTHNFNTLTFTGHTHPSSEIYDFDITGHTHQADTIAGFDVTGHTHDFNNLSSTAHTHYISQLGDVLLTGTESGQTLVYQDGSWINMTTQGSDLTGYWNSAQTLTAIDTYSVHLLSSLDDVDSGITGASTGQALVWDSSVNKWVASGVTVDMTNYYTKVEVDSNYYTTGQTTALFSQTGHSHNMADLLDVSDVLANDGDVLQFSAGTWSPASSIMSGNYVLKTGDTMSGDLFFDFMTGSTNRNLYVSGDGGVREGSTIVSLYMTDPLLIAFISSGDTGWSGSTFVDQAISGFTMYDGQRYVDNDFTYEYVDGILYRSYYSKANHQHGDIYYTKDQLLVDGVLDDRYVTASGTTNLTDLADVSVVLNDLTDNSYLKYDTATGLWIQSDINMSSYALITDVIPNTTEVLAGSKLSGGGQLVSGVTISHSTLPVTATQVAADSNSNVILSVDGDGYGHITGYTYANISSVIKNNLVDMEDFGLVLPGLQDKQVIMYSSGDTLFHNVTLSKTMIPDLDDSQYVLVTGDQTIAGQKTFTGDMFTSNMFINGNLFVSGTTTSINTEDLLVKDKVITLNSGQTTGSGVMGGIAGIEIIRGSYPNYQIIMSETPGNPNGATFRVGNFGQTIAVATREDDGVIVDGGVAHWNTTTRKFITSTGLTMSGNTLNINGGLSFGTGTTVTGITNDLLVSATSNELVTASAVVNYVNNVTPNTTNILYVDSNSVSNSATGSIIKPYNTIQDALSSISNKFTISGDTHNSSVIDGISDADNTVIKVGMNVCSSNNSYGTVVLSKNNEGGNSNSIVISNDSIGTGTGVTLTLVDRYTTMVMPGIYTIGSSIMVDGVAVVTMKNSYINYTGATALIDSTTEYKVGFSLLGNGTVKTTGFINISGVSWSLNNDALVRVEVDVVDCDDFLVVNGSQQSSVVVTGKSVTTTNNILEVNNAGEIEFDIDFISGGDSIISGTTMFINRGTIQYGNIQLLSSTMVNEGTLSSYNSNTYNVLVDSNSVFDNNGTMSDTSVGYYTHGMVHLDSGSTFTVNGKMLRNDSHKPYITCDNGTVIGVSNLLVNCNAGGFYKIPPRLIEVSVLVSGTTTSIDISGITYGSVSSPTGKTTTALAVELGDVINSGSTAIAFFSGNIPSSTLFITVNNGDFVESNLVNLGTVSTRPYTGYSVYDNIGGFVVENVNIR